MPSSSADTTSTTIRAAYGRLIGRWRGTRTIGRASYEPSYPPIPWDQHLAVAPNGEVLLAFNAWNFWTRAGPRGVGVVWRAPRHPFGAAQALRNAPGGAIPEFDARGNAYMYGYCSGLVLIAPGHTHRSGARSC